MKVSSGRGPLASVGACVVLLLLSAGCLSAQAPTQWVLRDPIPHLMSEMYCHSDMVFVRRGESTFVYLCNTDYNNNVSYLNAFRPQLGTWSEDLPAPPFGVNVALAYARDAMRMYAIGFFPSNGGNRFYTYTFDSWSGSTGSWSSEALPFELNTSADCRGAMMTYRRNRNLSPMHAIPGWLYAAAGPYREAYIWRYSIPNPGDAAVDGYNPGNKAVIADATPHFTWPAVAFAAEYHIKVSADSSFAVAEVDAIVPGNEYQVPEAGALSNGLKCWQVQTIDSAGSAMEGPVLQFTLDAGWERITEIPLPGDDPWLMNNMTLNYTCKGAVWPKQESLWVTTGTIWAEQMYVYSIHNGTWSTFPLKHSHPGGDNKHDMMASAPSEYWLQESKQIYAVMDTFGDDAHHWKIDLAAGAWQSLQASYPFPVMTTYCCRLVFDAELDTLYATTGGHDNVNQFYSRCPGSNLNTAPVTDGAQAGANGTQLPGLSATARGDAVSIRYTLSVWERARLDIFDPVGRKVMTRDMGVQTAGNHCEQVSRSELGAQAGVYLLKLTHGTASEQAKVVLY